MLICLNLVSLNFVSSFFTTARDDIAPGRSYFFVSDDSSGTRSEYLAVFDLNFDATPSRAHRSMSLSLLAHIAVVEPTLRVMFPQSLRVAPCREWGLFNGTHLDVDALPVAILARGPGIHDLALVVSLVFAVKLWQGQLVAWACWLAKRLLSCWDLWQTTVRGSHV